MISVNEFKTDGKNTLSNLYDRAVESGELEIFIPEGQYILERPILMKSNMTIIADEKAYIQALDGEFLKEKSVMIGGYGVSNIAVKGGHWNGNVSGNPRESYCKSVQTGVIFDFIGVDGLTVSDLTMTDAGSYHLRIGETKNFLVENIVFDDDTYVKCQDGVHICGFSENGIIRNITAKRRATNDDLIAINADEILWYSQNKGMKCGYIKNILVENLIGEDVYTAIRILSTESEISDITIRNIKMGCRYYFLNMDGARYCSDSFYPKNSYPEVCGIIKNVTIENVEIHKVAETMYPLIVFETRADNFILKNFKRTPDTGTMPRVPTIRIQHAPTSVATLNGKAFPIPGIFDGNEISEFKVDSPDLRVC